MKVAYNDTELEFEVAGDDYQLQGPDNFLAGVGGKPINFKHLHPPGAVSSIQFVYPDGLSASQERILKEVASTLHEELDTDED